MLTVWSADADGSAQPLHSLAMNHEPVALHAALAGDASTHVLAVTKANAVLVWHLGAPPKSAAKKDAAAAAALTPVFRVALAKRDKSKADKAKSGGADDYALLSARFGGASAGAGARSLVVASGSAAVPHFDTLAYTDAEQRVLAAAAAEIPRRAGGALLAQSTSGDDSKKVRAVPSEAQ